MRAVAPKSKMPNILTSFTSRLKTSPRGWILPVVIGGLASISWSFPQTYASIPKAQQHIRYIRTLNRLHQEIYPQQGIIATSLAQLHQQLDRSEPLPSQSNLYKLSVRITKKAVLNYGKTKLANHNQNGDGLATRSKQKEIGKFSHSLNIVTK